MNIPGYDSWKLASPYDDEQEWTETITDVACGAGYECDWSGEIEAECVGDEDTYTYYWKCPGCQSYNEGQVNS